MASAQSTDIKTTSPQIRGPQAGENWVIVLPNDRGLSPEKSEGFAYHGNEAPPKSQKGWLALVEEDDGWYLKPTTMKVRRVKDVILDVDEGAKPTGSLVSSKEYPKAILLLRHPALKAGKVTAPAEAGWKPEYRENDSKHYWHTFNLNDKPYWLELYKDLRTGQDEYAINEWVLDKLFLYSAKPEKPAISNPKRGKEQNQDIFSNIHYVWTGDLNGDGKPDFVVHFNGYNHSGVCLHLSSQSDSGKDGAFPRRVACQVTLGC